MVHGGGAFAAQFAPLLAGLEKQFRIFAPDRPGCGLSDNFNYRGVPFREHAVGFMTDLLDALRLPKSAVVGNSMGGYWALAFALAAPERVTRLVLLGGAAGSLPPPYPPRPPRPEPSLATTRQTYRFLMANGDRAPNEVLEADYAASRLPGAALGWDSMLEELDREGIGRTGLTYALRPELRNLRPATLFIWGDKDFEGPPSLAQEMAALAPNARCEVVKDAGHLVWLDQPSRCLTLLSDFLKSGARN
jgi:pimeloyl-ACP methyl ester carboxylesterase